MVTFAGWLMEQESRNDWTGVIACWWRDEAADRPRVFSPSGIQKWLDKQILHGKLGENMPDERRGEWRKAYADAVRQYHDRLDAGGSPKEDARLVRIEEKLDRILAFFESVSAEAGLESAADARAAMTRQEPPSGPPEAQETGPDGIWPQLYALADHAGAEAAEGSTEDAA